MRRGGAFPLRCLGLAGTGNRAAPTGAGTACDTASPHLFLLPTPASPSPSRSSSPPLLLLPTLMSHPRLHFSSPSTPSSSPPSPPSSPPHSHFSVPTPASLSPADAQRQHLLQELTEMTPESSDRTSNDTQYSVPETPEPLAREEPQGALL